MKLCNWRLILAASLVEAWDLQTFSKFVSLDFLKEKKRRSWWGKVLRETNIPPNFLREDKKNVLMRENLEGNIPPDPKRTKRMFWWGKVLRETSHPIQATNASPVRNPITAPRSSTRLKFGTLRWCDGFSNWIVCFSHFFYVYVHISDQKTHLARTPRVKRPNRGPPTTPNMVKEAYTRLVIKAIKKSQES